MNTKELIDKILLYTYNIVATDASAATQRLKALEWAQETADEVWNSADWDFAYTSTTLTIPAGQGYAALPADFVRFGSKASPFNSLNWGIPMEEVNPRVIQSLENWPGSISRVNKFAVYRADDGVMRFQVGSTAAHTIEVYYKFRMPTLVDTDHATNSNLQYIPLQYHYSVMLAGVKAKAPRQVGDPRPDWEILFQRGLAAMRQELQVKRSTTRQLGRALPHQW